VANVSAPVIEDLPSLHESRCRLPRWRRAFAVALLLAPCAARAGDVYYPEYKRDPVPPVAVIEGVVVQDDGGEPACNAANEDCEDPHPEPLPPAVAGAEDAAVRASDQPVVSRPKGLKSVPTSYTSTRSAFFNAFTRR
jgi:hypothetical protein